MTIWEKCIEDAVRNEDLFPVDCLEILKNNYAGRLEVMKPKTIIKKICDLMGSQGESQGYVDEAIIIVHQWLDDADHKPTWQPRTIHEYIEMIKKVERISPQLLPGWDDLSDGEKKVLENIPINISNYIDEI